MTIFLLWLAAAAQDDPAREVRELIEQLRADRFEDREAAMGRLKLHGPRALPALREAARSTDGELALRAARVLKVVEIRVRLSDGLLRAFPDVDERLADGPDSAWTAVFKEALERLEPEGLRRADLEPLARPALLGAQGADRERVVAAIGALKLRSAIPDLLDQLDVPDWSLFTRTVHVLLELEGLEAMLPRLLGLLRGDAEQGRRNAQWALGRCPREKVARPLRALLGAGDVEPRVHALGVLEEVRAAEALPEILPLLDDPSPSLRAAAAKAVGTLGGRSASGRLRALLRDDAPVVRAHAAGALGFLEIREAGVELARLLEDPEEDVRFMAVRSLVRLRSPETVPLLLKALDDVHGPVRLGALEALAACGAREAIPRVARLLGEKNHDTVAAAARALGQLGAREHAPDLVPLLASPEWHVRGWAGHALVEMGADEGLEATVVLLRDPANMARGPDLLARWTTAERAPRVAPLLEHADPRVRAAAARALEPHQAAGRLAALLDDPHADVREKALWSLLRTRPAGVADKVAARLKDESPKVRLAAVRVFPHASAKPDLGLLVPLLEDPDEGVRQAVCGTLGDHGARAFAADVRKRLADPSGMVRIHAARALGRMGAKEAAPDVMKFLGDRNPVVRWHAAAALGEMRAKEAVDGLLRLLADDHANVRRESAGALGRIRDARAVEPLRRLLDDPEPEVREAARRALAALDPK
ncbi:MAG TPA: HEAT repeat domain-containing protein [Planctomycetota bacterium]|nr:HEAT repeat domain-containing protein [Planctomycetota bacterium]